MKAVFHVSSPDPHDHHHAMVNVLNLLADDTVSVAGDEVALVTNGGAIRMFVESAAEHAEMVARIEEAGVALSACGNALRGQGVPAEDLLPGVEVVPSGVGELARLQAAGYGYIKAP
jgi:intracellular sulfur oxidation DsrE/DsrF family protein